MPKKKRPRPPRNRTTMHTVDEDGKRHQLQLPRKFKPGFLDELDTTTPGVAKLRSRYGLLVNHTGAGTNVMKQVLCQRFTLLWMEIETLEVEALTEGKRLPPRWISLLHTMTGLAKTLGLEQAQAETMNIHHELERILNKE